LEQDVRRLSVYTDPSATMHSVTDEQTVGQTDRRHYDANSRSYLARTDQGSLCCVIFDSILQNALEYLIFGCV